MRRRRRTGLTFIGLFFCLSVVWSASASDFTFKDLKQLVVDHQVRTTNDLLPYLPVSLKNRFTLMADTRSAQDANSLFPRVILFGDSAQLIVAFNGSADQFGFGGLDVIEFDESSAKFNFKSVHFNQGRAQFDEHPETCSGCHGPNPNDMRPIWDLYPVWRGAYGAIDDQLGGYKGKSDQRSDFFRFLTTSGAGLPYSALKLGSAGDFVEPYDNVGRTTYHFDHRPNLMLNAMLDRLEAKRVARIVLGSPRYSSLRYQIISALTKCSGAALTKSPVWSRERRDALAFLDQHFAGFTFFYPRESDLPLETLAVADTLAINPQDWSLTFVLNSFILYDGIDNFDELLGHELIKSLAQTEVEFAEYTAPDGHVPAYTPEGKLLLQLGGTPPVDANLRAKLCEHLRRHI